MTSGEDQGHQGGDGQGLLYLMGERLVGTPKLPEEPGSPDSIGRNFSFHPLLLTKGGQGIISGQADRARRRRGETEMQIKVRYRF